MNESDRSFLTGADGVLDMIGAISFRRSPPPKRRQNDAILVDENLLQRRFVLETRRRDFVIRRRESDETISEYLNADGKCKVRKARHLVLLIVLHITCE